MEMVGDGLQDIITGLACTDCLLKIVKWSRSEGVGNAELSKLNLFTEMSPIR